MPGVCPKCVAIRDEGVICHKCGTRLVSTQTWKQDRQSLINNPLVNPTPKAPSFLNPPPFQVQTGKEETAATAEEKKDFVLGFFIGALLFFVALISSYYIFGDLFK